MTRCEQYQPQLLDYLYDLLDAAERAAVKEHLEACSVCQGALEHAHRQQRLLSVAAKGRFPSVSFRPPSATPAADRPPEADRLSSRRRPWAAWSIAATLLLAVGGLGSLQLLQHREEHRAIQAEARYQEAADEIKQLAARQQTARTEIAAKLEQLAGAWKNLPLQEQTKLQALQNRQLNVVVSGPETVQAGAPTEYHIQTYNLNNQPVEAKVSARVLDQSQKVVYEEKDILSKGDHSLILPRDLPVKPDSELSLEVDARKEDGSREELREKVKLVGPAYVTQLITDKPMYRPGEVVHFRSLTLDRYSLKPPAEDFHLTYTLNTPKGEENVILDGTTPLLAGQQDQSAVLGPDKQPLRGIGSGDYTIDPAAAGGEYTLTVKDANNRFPAEKRKFIVNQYERPQLNKELDFSRKSYGPGDEVSAACRVARAEGGSPVADRPVTASIHIDGKPYGADGKESGTGLVLRTDSKGAVNVRFKLPPNMERGQGSLSVQFNDGAHVETLVRAIPILLKKLQIEFFPEGGDLVAGVPNRVYVQARTTLDKPADLKGQVVDQDGRVVAVDVHTLTDAEHPGVNQGMGRFTFQPEAGKKYELKIVSPAGMEGQYLLPAAKTEGVVLSVPTGVSTPGQPIQVVVQSSQKDLSLLVGAYCRGRLLDHRTILAKKGEAMRLDLTPVQETGGVYRVTVFEDRNQAGNRHQLVPVAERLVYRLPAEKLQLSIKADRKQYTPGDKVKLTVASTTEKAQPAPAVVTLGVVDKSVVTLADEKTARGLPTHFYLATEVRKPEDLEYADFLLTSHPKAREALDLLLGTQGWRRFAEQEPAKFRQQQKEEGERLLVMEGLATPATVSLLQQQLQRIKHETAQEYQKLYLQYLTTGQTWEALQKGEDFTREAQRLHDESDAARQDYAAATARMNQLARRVGFWVWPVLGVTLALLILSLVLGMLGHVPRALPYYVTAGACTLSVMGVMLTLQGRQPPAMLDLADFAAPHLASVEDKPARESRDETKQRWESVEQLARRAGPADPRLDFGFGGGGFGEGGALGWADRPVPLGGAGGMPEGLNELNRPMQFGMGRTGIAAPQLDAFRGGMIYNGADARRLKEAHWAFMGKDRDDNADKYNLWYRAEERKAGEKEDVRLKARVNAAARQFAPVAGPAPADGLRKRAGVLAQQPPEGRLPELGVLRLQQAPGGGPGAMGGRGMGRAAAGGIQAVPPPAPLVVREYAHVHSADPSGVRSDFAETVCWYAALVLADGKAEVSFDLSDSVTSFQVAVCGHTLNGRLGAATATVESRLPFTLEPKIPIEITAGDIVDIPVSIANNTDVERPVSLRLTTAGLTLQGKAEEQFTLPADQRTRRLFRVQPATVEGVAQIHLEGQSRPFADSITRSFAIVPSGFPISASHSDVVEKTAVQEVTLPESWIKGTLKCQVHVYPSMLASLQKGLEGLLREPGGCFEQTSSSNYPNLLILDYLRESDQAKPEVERRARDLLASGYKQLTAFECLEQGQNKRQGYEWFGGTAPPHEALTAYGLLEFRDMSRVYDVDPSMVERTRTYLLSRRDGKGGFQRNTKALDQFGRAPEETTNAYIVWALTEGGKEDDVSKELAALTEQAKTSKDAYFLALVANSLLNRGKTEEAVALLKTLADAQKPDGHLDSEKPSITGSGGRDLQIETTALTVLAWLKANRPEYAKNVQSATKWIGQQRSGSGSFGSTQSTILALKALIAFTRANKKAAEAGKLVLFVGPEVVAQSTFAANVQEVLTLDVPEPEKLLHAGKNLVRVEITGNNVFPYTLSWSYRSLKPLSAAQAPVHLTTRLDRQEAQEGETVHLTMQVENASGRGQAMTVAIIGLPAGLTLPEDMKQLKEHARLRDNGQEPGLISAWETRGRELILYWRDLGPDNKIEVPIDLICRVPGQYSGPASRAYLYYNADHKDWAEPLAVTIHARSE